MSYMQLLVAHWANGMYWLFWNVLAMLGLWGAGLTIFTFLENAPWLELVDRGQFFLYSVGFLGQGMYVLTKEHRITTIPNRRLLVSLTVSCFLICTLFFAGFVLSNFSNSPDINPNPAILRYVGFFILLVSMALGFLVTLAAEERGDIDFSRLGQQGVRRLEEQIPEE